MKTEVLVAGASLGGLMAAIRACKMGCKVVLTEETDWIGGQLTSQAVPPDEHPWIEEKWCTDTYRWYRDEIRRRCMERYNYKEEYIENLNPGLATVSRISHQPLMAHEVLQDMIEPYIKTKQLVLLLNTKVIYAETSNRKVTCVQVDDENQTMIEAEFFIDGTDNGDLFPLIGEQYRIGSDGKLFNESYALEKADPNDLQPVTWVAAVEWMDQAVEPIEKPKYYDFFKKQLLPTGEQEEKALLSWWGPDSSTGKAKEFTMFEGGDLFSLWTYRRVYTTKNLKEAFDIRGNKVPEYRDEHPVGDVTLINWPQNDYIFGNLIEDKLLKKFNNIEEKSSVSYHWEMAKQLTLSLIYWLQTEAGYPNIAMNKDVLGTDDGLAKYPYIREGRRLDSEFVVVQNHLTPKKEALSKEVKGDKIEVARFDDSVGIGSYHLDLHMTTSSKQFMYAESIPFEIPLGMLKSKCFDNFMPASKNIGSTHITNSCFRLHPVEWNVGEAAGEYAVKYLREIRS